MGDMGGEDFWVCLTFLGFFCLCFQVQVLNSQNTTCNSSDLRALNDFMKGLDSGVPLWRNASSSDCCSWVGVNCSVPSWGLEKRVVELNLGKMGLKGGVVESVFVGLDQLRVLNLSRNSLKGAVPSGLFQLQRLEVLDLSSNGFNGSVPADINLPSIRVFNIAGNSFVGSQPRLVGSMNLMDFSISYNSFSGSIDTGICDVSRRIQNLQLSSNFFYGIVPAGFGNCSILQKLSLDSNNLTGNLPHDLFGLASLSRLYLQDNFLSGQVSNRIGNLSNLSRLDLSLNLFSGMIPDVFGSLGGLQYLSAHSNNLTGQLPASLSNLSMLQFLNLRNNSIGGEIDLNCTAMTHLSSLDLGSNLFGGRNLINLSLCKELRALNLARNGLDVEIPESFRNLQALTHLSLTNTGLRNIFVALSILQHCKNLSKLVLTSNFRGEDMPLNGIQEFANIKVFIIPNCGLRGQIPSWLERFSKLQLLDLSWNQLSGTVPPWIGNFSSLFYLDLSNNSLTGEIPESLTQLPGLISRNISLADPPMDIPFYSRSNKGTRGLQYNKVASFKPTLDLSENKLTGVIQPGFGKLKKLHVLNLCRNMLTGIIPKELSGMTSLEVLDLSFNNLSGNIPLSLTNLSFLSDFNVANNQLWGSIPSWGQFSTFPNSSFEGNKDLCGMHFPPCQDLIPSLSRSKQRTNRKIIIGMALGIGSGTSLLLALVYVFVSRNHVQRPNDIEREVASTKDELELSGSKLVLLFQNKDNKEITIDDLLKSTNNFDQANIIGCGGFGLVYKAALPDGRKVAIKRMSGDDGQIEREFQAEVEALSRAQHMNLVSLQGYCKYRSDRLLIYSYMENGSLDYWLHEKLDGGSALDWNTRLRIAQGAGRALAYLHQSCQPHILHRDIKSSNILLDENFEARLADFGLARLILPYDTHVTTDLVGTLGYIPPEYGQASIATFKGDVYSFGVVLLELLTSKRPMDMCKPKGRRDMISWVLQMKKDARAREVFDPFIYDKEHDKQMMEVLDIACLCLNECPKLRPFIQQIVLWLDSVGVDRQESDAS
ncbi:hypothetical protein AAC387_Pa04g2196 [Persea americana]